MSESKTLSEKEIDEFLSDLDKNNNGYIEYHELEHKLDEVHQEIAQKPQKHHLHHADRADEQRHEFLRSVLSTNDERISRTAFAKAVREWKVPSMKPGMKIEDDHKNYMKNLPWGRRFKAYWSVRGPEIVFMALVISMQIAFGTWQLVSYLTEPKYRRAFGWGVVLAKTSAGVL